MTIDECMLYLRPQLLVVVEQLILESFHAATDGELSLQSIIIYNDNDSDDNDSDDRDDDDDRENCAYTLEHFIYSPVYPCINQSIYQYQSIHLFNYLSIHPSMHLFNH